MVYFWLFFYLILSNLCKIGKDWKGLERIGKDEDCKKERLIAGKQQGLHHVFQT